MAGNTLRQANKPWSKLKRDLGLIAGATFAPVIFFTIDWTNGQSALFPRSGSIMVLCAGILSYLSLERHYQKFYNAARFGRDPLLTSPQQEGINWTTLGIAAAGTVIWGYGDLLFCWLYPSR